MNILLFDLIYLTDVCFIFSCVWYDYCLLEYAHLYILQYKLKGL